jgi:hypothetical protein
LNAQSKNLVVRATDGWFSPRAFTFRETDIWAPGLDYCFLRLTHSRVVVKDAKKAVPHEAGYNDLFYSDALDWQDCEWRAERHANNESDRPGPRATVALRLQRCPLKKTQQGLECTPWGGQMGKVRIG